VVLAARSATAKSWYCVRAVYVAIPAAIAAATAALRVVPPGALASVPNSAHAARTGPATVLLLSMGPATAVVRGALVGITSTTGAGTAVTAVGAVGALAVALFVLLAMVFTPYMHC